jgi:IclR family transcriptional regulator, acetate operon repressor
MRNVQVTGKIRAHRGTHIQSVDRAARLLLVVASRETNGSCKALALATGLATPTTHHLLGTLVAKGLLSRDAEARYLLGPEVAVLADAFHQQHPVPEHLLIPLRQLADTTGETTYLGAWRQGNIQTLAMAEGNLPVRVSVPSAGRYRDAHARAAGKVLLAYAADGLRDAYLLANPLRALTPRTIVDADALEAELRRVRKAGYAVEEEEFLPGVGCISVPVLRSGVLIAAYSMLIPLQRFSARRDDLIRALLSTARTVEDGISGTGLPGSVAPIHAGTRAKRAGTHLRLRSDG